MTIIKKLQFKPFVGLSSIHLQMIVAAYSPAGVPPPTEQWLVDIGNGDKLSCEISIPPNWKSGDKTIALIHGLGGCYQSGYMIRMARKLYQRGDKVVRINLRSCGSGIGLSKLPYCGGTSEDIRMVLQSLKNENIESSITLIGFSLGGNIALKLAGELGEEAQKLVNTVIAVCPPVDLAETVRLIQQPRFKIYHRYYLKNVLNQARPWVHQKIRSVYEYDDFITAPSWGFSGAQEYYQKCSSQIFLRKIHCKTHVLFAEDDPFVSMAPLHEIPLPPQVQVWATEYGSHMGFIGGSNQESGFYWMDQLLLAWTT